MRRPPRQRTTAAPLTERIVDAAFARAARDGWARVRLHEVANDLGVPLAAIYPHFADLDAVGNAMLDRADRAMLAAAPALTARAPRERVEGLILAWLAVLAPHRPAIANFLRYKFAFAHIHLRAALIVRLSRTVQWLREAAAFDATGLRHDVEEVGLTALFAATVIDWLGDDTEDTLTRRRLSRRLDCADRAMARLFAAPSTRRGATFTSG